MDMNPIKDDTLNRIHVKEIDFDTGKRLQLQEIKPKSLYGDNWYDSISLNKTSIDTRVFSIDHTSGKSSYTSLDYKSKYDGLIGIAPYDVDKHVDDSFLWQIKKNGDVDHMIVALTDKKVQFGSFDPESILPGYELDMYQTTSTKAWNLKADQFHFGQTNMPAKRLISIEPQVEYIYVPDSDFQHFRSKFLKMEEFEPNCQSDDLMCRFNKHCNDVKVGSNLDLRIRIYDPSQSLDIIIDGQDLLIPGDQIGGSEGGNFCYIGIQKQTHLSKSLWTIGNVILKKYLIVYDMTPFNELHKDYIQIGIAPKNPDYDVEVIPLPPPVVEPVKPKEDPVVIPTTPEDTTPEKPKTPEAEDQQKPE